MMMQSMITLNGNRKKKSATSRSVPSLKAVKILVKKIRDIIAVKLVAWERNAWGHVCQKKEKKNQVVSGRQ